MENQKISFEIYAVIFATIVGVFILYLAGAWGWYFYSNGRAKSGSTIGREFRKS